MCTYSPQYPAIVAEYPIRCYKYLCKRPDGTYVTPYQLSPVEEGQFYEISDEQRENRQICVLQSHKLPYLLMHDEMPDVPYGEGETFFEIGKGMFHSYIYHEPCTKLFNTHALDPVKQMSLFEPAIAVCYIPAKTKYFIGWNRITSSDTIIAFRPDKPYWVQRTPEYCYSAQGDPDCYASEKIYYAKIYDNLKEFYKDETTNKMW